jgi:hypothetical protein
MADGQHKLSRRALLGAVCAAPLVRHPELVSGSSSPPHERVTRWTLKQVQGDEAAESCAVTLWDQALARFHHVQAVLDSAKSEPDEDAYDALLDAHSEALTTLLALPAPDLAAIAAKLDVIVPQLAWELNGSEDCLERLRQDAHRLAASGSA